MAITLVLSMSMCVYIVYPPRVDVYKMLEHVLYTMCIYPLPAPSDTIRKTTLCAELRRRQSRQLDFLFSYSLYVFVCVYEFESA